MIPETYPELIEPSDISYAEKSLAEIGAANSEQCGDVGSPDNNGGTCDGRGHYRRKQGDDRLDGGSGDNGRQDCGGGGGYDRLDGSSCGFGREHGDESHHGGSDDDRHDGGSDYDRRE